MNEQRELQLKPSYVNYKQVAKIMSSAAWHVPCYCAGTYNKDGTFTKRTEWQDGFNAGTSAVTSELRRIAKMAQEAENPENELIRVKLGLMGDVKSFTGWCRQRYWPEILSDVDLNGGGCD
jgi:hypothetical protein